MPSFFPPAIYANTPAEYRDVVVTYLRQIRDQLTREANRMTPGNERTGLLGKAYQCDIIAETLALAPIAPTGTGRQSWRTPNLSPPPTTGR